MPTGRNSPPLVGRGNAWRIARKLQLQIEQGELSSGSRLPSYRTLMREFQVTSGTISYAMQILEQFGYVERRHGSGVYVRIIQANDRPKKNQSGLYALVVPEIESGLYLSLQAGMEAAAGANREQLITMTSGASATQQADALLQLIDRDVSGIALVPCYEPSHAYQLRHLHRSGIPLVLLHRGIADVPAPSIQIPFTEVGQLAGANLAKYGHRVVGAFLGPRSEVATQYLNGLINGLRLGNAELANDAVSYCDSMLVSPRDYSNYRKLVDQELSRMLSLMHPPTAFFVSFDRMAEMVYAVAVEKGLSVPKDLSIVCCAGNRCSSPIRPLISSVVVDERDAGRKAHELLSRMRSGDLALDCGKSFMAPIVFDSAQTLRPPARC